MNNTAIINRIENDRIYLMHIVDYGKKEQTEREFWNVEKQDFKSLNPENFKLGLGDAVEYYIPEGKTIMASFMVLIFPLLSFLITYATLSQLGLKSEKLSALLSLAVMGASFFINKLFKKMGIKETLPIITKIVTKESLASIQEGCKDCGSCSVCK